MSKSKFKLDNEFKTSFEIGQLVPFYYQDVVPGDNIEVKTNALIRFEPLIAPIMHKVDLSMRYYFVPYRLLMKNFDRMLFSPDDPITVPSLRQALNISTGIPVRYGSLLRAFGINTSTPEWTPEILHRLSALPFYAYWVIVNYYYRHPLFDPLYHDHLEWEDFNEFPLLQLHNVNFSKDYFTSCFKDTQLGSEMELDIDGNNTIKVSEMRLAEKLQQYKERLLLATNKKRGNRYITYLKEFFGVAPDLGLTEWPLYLGGEDTMLSISDVDQTSQTTESAPLGSPAGKSLSLSDRMNKIELNATEHGIILGLAYVRPRQSYQAGIPREFIKRDYYDFYIPLFANLGLQEIYNCELDASRTGTFGYNYRFNELRQSKDIIAGNFTSEDFWHLGRDIRKEYLSNNFLKVTHENNNRIFAYPSIYRATGEKILPSKIGYVLRPTFTGSAITSFTYSVITEAERAALPFDYEPDLNNPEHIAAIIGVFGVTSIPRTSAEPSVDAGIVLPHIVYTYYLRKDLEFTCTMMLNIPTGLDQAIRDRQLLMPYFSYIVLPVSIGENYTPDDWIEQYNNNITHPDDADTTIYTVFDSFANDSITYSFVGNGQIVPPSPSSSQSPVPTSGRGEDNKIIRTEDGTVMEYVENNHIKAVFYNNVDALRPVPYEYNPMI